MTNKYANYPGKIPFFLGGCEFVDEAENLARDRLKRFINSDSYKH